MSIPILSNLAKQVAKGMGVDPVLVCAVCEKESSWRPDATRFEPAFLQHYVLKLKLSADESKGRATSWGLMQIMGEVAREEGFGGEFSELLQPEIGLQAGIRHLKRYLDLAHGDVEAALLHWNGGADKKYPAAVLALKQKYQ